jgi:putative phage-type endonuclease
VTPAIHDVGTPVDGVDPANAVQILPPGVDRTSRQVWLAARRTGIGGSDISTLVGLNRWSSRYELWLDKTGQLPLVDEQSEAAEMGMLLEPVVRERFARVQHLHVTPVGTLRSVRWPWMLANPDGLCSDGDGYEGKTAGTWQGAEWARGQTADHAELQAQWGMAVTGLPGWWVAALIGGQRNTYRHIDRDQHLIDELVAISQRFWTRNVELQVEPDADGSQACTDTLNARYPQPATDLEVQIDEEAADQLAAAKTRAAAAEKAAHAEHEQVKNRTRQLLGRGERLTTGERVIATWTHIDALNMSRLTTDHPDLVEQYTRPVKADEFDLDAFKTEQPDTYKAYRQRRLHFQ